MDKIAASIAQVAAEATPVSRGHRETIELPPPLSAALDTWIDAQPEPKPSRPDVLQLALTDWLTGQGYVRHHEDSEGAN